MTSIYSIDIQGQSGVLRVDGEYKIEYYMLQLAANGRRRVQ